jgi:hypothetical protein
VTPLALSFTPAAPPGLMEAGAICVRKCVPLLECLNRHNTIPRNQGREFPYAQTLQSAFGMRIPALRVVFLSDCATRRLCAVPSHVSEFIRRDAWRTGCPPLPRATMPRSTHRRRDKDTPTYRPQHESRPAQSKRSHTHCLRFVIYYFAAARQHCSKRPQREPDIWLRAHRAPNRRKCA